MPRGFTTAYLVDGPLDNHELPNIPINMLRDEIQIFSGSGFTKENNGAVGVFKGASKLPSNWLSQKSHVYRKALNEKHRKGVLLHFVRTLIIDRCEATIKAGTWCKNQANEGSSFCPVHDK